MMYGNIAIKYTWYEKENCTVEEASSAIIGILCGPQRSTHKFISHAMAIFDTWERTMIIHMLHNPFEGSCKYWSPLQIHTSIKSYAHVLESGVAIANGQLGRASFL